MTIEHKMRLLKALRTLHVYNKLDILSSMTGVPTAKLIKTVTTNKIDTLSDTEWSLVSLGYEDKN